MNFGGEAVKAWKNIWGCGQGIGPIKAVVPARELVERLGREYLAARRRMGLACEEAWKAAGDDGAATGPIARCYSLWLTRASHFPCVPAVETTVKTGRCSAKRSSRLAEGLVPTNCIGNRCEG